MKLYLPRNELLMKGYFFSEYFSFAFNQFIMASLPSEDLAHQEGLCIRCKAVPLKKKCPPPPQKLTLIFILILENKKKIVRSLILKCMDDVALARLCVSLKIAYQNVSRIDKDSYRCNHFFYVSIYPTPLLHQVQDVTRDPFLS